MLKCSLGVVIVLDELTWGHVQETVLLHGNVPVGWFGGSCGRLLLLQILGTPESHQWWFPEDIVGRAIIVKDLELS